MRLKSIFAQSIFLKPKLTLTQWSEKYRILSQESSAFFGRFRPLPYQKEPMDAISDENIEEVVLMWGSQLGKSEILNNTIGYFIHQNPSTILFLLPTEDIAEDYSKRRLAPMFRDCKEIGKLIHDREANNTILIKNFKGGNLALVGSNSPSKLASKPIKVLVVDEVDRCENTKEGHSIDLAQKRTITFFDRKIIKVSTPTIKGFSTIEREFEESDKRYFYVPCPHCSFYQTLRFPQIKWDKDKEGKARLESVRYACIECGSLWNEEEKNKAVSLGEWRANNPSSKKAGFFLNAIYSPFFTLEEIVKSFLESKNIASKMQVFTNTILAECFEPPSVKFEELEIFKRREDYHPQALNDAILFLTAGVDVQSNRIEIEVRGWGEGFESWGVKYFKLWGDTKGSQVWQEAYKALQEVYTTQKGRKLGVRMALIDSGFLSERVYSFVQLDKRFFASKGSSETSTKKDFISKPRKIKDGCYLYSIGTFEGKSEVFSMLEVAEAGAGYIHFPTSYDMEYFRQLTAEKLFKTTNAQGYTTYRWEKIRERNEALDVFVLNLACAKIMRLDLYTCKKIKRVGSQAP